MKQTNCKQIDDWSKSSVRWDSHNGIPFAVSDRGFIYMPEYKDTMGRPVSQNCTNGNPNTWGYYQVQIGRKNHKVHILVAENFIGSRPRGMQVDHIDGDKSNNSIENLRYLTPSQNQGAWKSPRVNKTSRYRGVCRVESRKKWLSTIKVNGKSRYLGCFDDENKAAIAYNQAAIELGRPKECLNTIQDACV